MDGNIPQEFYRVRSWGDRYFHTNSKGHATVKLHGKEGDLFQLVESLVERGIEPPILLRFDAIIKDRIERLYDAFRSAKEKFHYDGSYMFAYPIKVNPQRHVVDQIQKEGKHFSIGLEVGSKPELLAVLTTERASDSLLLCNGYKDAEYVEMAILANKLGIRTMVVIEQLYELDLILDAAKKLQFTPEIGIRFRPSSKGSGRWRTSGGDFAKFGLDASEITLCLAKLEKEGCLDWLKLFHFHLGSQITSIESIKTALKEASRLYVEAAKKAKSLAYFDVGGGLGVDYDGSRTISDSSLNYSMEEYARDVVYSIADACDEEGIPHPDIISESGRALSAFHSLLIIEVIDISKSEEAGSVTKPPEGASYICTDFYDLYNQLTPENALESLHDAMEFKEKIIDDFISGAMTLEERAYAEKMYRHVIVKIIQEAQKLPDIPEEILDVNKNRLDMYFCNFSVFQSLTDSWAIDQLFPVMPIHRLNERPSKKAIIADLSCDSDGKIDKFVGYKGRTHSYISLHEVPPYPYYLGVYLVGAYQEVLGGLHNLFGDTNVVHVDLDEKGEWVVKQVIEGDTIHDVLSYTQYDPKDLLLNVRRLIEKSLAEGRLTREESARLQKKMKQSLESYTYLVT